MNIDKTQYESEVKFLAKIEKAIEEGTWIMRTELIKGIRDRQKEKVKLLFEQINN